MLMEDASAASDEQQMRPPLITLSIQRKPSLLPRPEITYDEMTRIRYYRQLALHGIFWSGKDNSATTVSIDPRGRREAEACNLR